MRHVMWVAGLGGSLSLGLGAWGSWVVYPRDVVFTGFGVTIYPELAVVGLLCAFAAIATGLLDWERRGRLAEPFPAMPIASPSRPARATKLRRAPAPGARTIVRRAAAHWRLPSPLPR